MILLTILQYVSLRQLEKQAYHDIQRMYVHTYMHLRQIDGVLLTLYSTEFASMLDS